MPAHHRYAATHAHRRLLKVALASCAIAFSTYGVAQIANGAGAGQQESRASDSTSRANPSGTTVHESNAPQSKDAGKSRGATAGKDHKTEGAGGFGNGLYGTGAGNNK